MKTLSQLLLGLTMVLVGLLASSAHRSEAFGYPEEASLERVLATHVPPRKVPPAVKLEGHWLMTLPSGFEHHVEIRSLGKKSCMLSIAEKAVVLEGLYKLKGQELRVTQPLDDRMTELKWTIWNQNVMILTGQQVPSHNGSVYLNATLSRLPDKCPHCLADDLND